MILRALRDRRHQRRERDLLAIADAIREMVSPWHSAACGCAWTTGPAPVVLSCPPHASQTGTVRDLIMWDAELPPQLHVLARLVVSRRTA